MKRDLYPAEWPAIARAVKNEADWACECCGCECRRPGEPFDTHRRTLTVAHLNHEPADCRPDNLMAMCPACHNRYDAPMRARNRRARGRGPVVVGGGV